MRHIESPTKTEPDFCVLGTASQEQKWIGARVPRKIAEVRNEVDPRDYREFAGVRDRAQTSFTERVIYRAMGGPRCGDLRDWPVIALWAKDIAAQLKVQAPAEPKRQSGPTPVL